MIQHIQDFLYSHPWWHATIGAILVGAPSVIALLFAWRDGHTAEEANRLREKLAQAMSDIGDLQKDLNRIESEKKDTLAKIAEHTKRPLTQAELISAKLREYCGKTAKISEGDGNWGPGAQIVNISEDNILTLFVPSSSTTPTAYSVNAQCDKLQIVYEAVGGCALQIKVLERYGEMMFWGDAKSWQDRKKIMQNTSRPKGPNIFHVSYLSLGSSERKGLALYAPTDGNLEFTLVTQTNGNETGTYYGDKLEISKMFAVLQVELLYEGFNSGTAKGDSGARAHGVFVTTFPS